MSNVINEEDMLDAFKQSLEAEDIIKARVILSYIEKVNKNTQTRILFELIRYDVRFHLPLLVYLIDQHKNFCQSYPIIEETLISHAIDYPDIFAKAFESEKVQNPILLFSIADKAKYK